MGSTYNDWHHGSCRQTRDANHGASILSLPAVGARLGMLVLFSPIAFDNGLAKLNGSCKLAQMVGVALTDINNSKFLRYDSATWLDS